MPPVSVLEYEIYHGQDGECVHCGWDQDVGEAGYELVDQTGEAWESGFCSTTCAQAWAGNRSLAVA